MDKSIVAAEDTCEGIGSLVLESKCGDSPVQINSIAIDLDCLMGETTQSLTHEHFSIRGFTAEMRKKDPKVCLPFASEGGDNMNLPPLPVPKFRLWQCSDCISDMRKKDPESTPGVIVAAKSGVGSSCVHKVQTKQITRNNSAGKNPSTGPHNPGKASSLSDGDIPFSSVPLTRKPKLRSLADILKEGENSIPAQQIEPELDHQAWLDAPKKGATKTLHRRTKIVLEDGEEDETDHLIAIAKRSKGLVIESNNNNTTSRSIKISKSESERDNSRPLLFDSLMCVKTDQNKAQKQMQDISDMSKGKKVEESGYSPYTLPPSNDGSLGVCNNHEKVALDLSLSSYKGKQECSGRHTEIPDLNELFVEKTNMTEELLTLHENSDMFFSSGKESDNSNTVKASKDQQERSLANSRTHLGPVGIHNNNPYMFNFHCTNSGGSSGVSSWFLNCDSNWGQLGRRTKIHSGPMNASRADLLWPPRGKNVSFDVSQPSGLEDQSCKGKNIKRAVTDWNFNISQPSGLDQPSSKPTIQLLSLMDQRIVSGSSLKLGRPMNKNGNPNDPFASSSFFRQSNDFPTLLNGARCSNNLKNIFSLGQVPTQKGNPKPVDLAGPRNISAPARRRKPPSEVCCTLNRNPADFSAPDPRNEFMISGKDLERWKRKRKDPSRPGGNN